MTPGFHQERPFAILFILFSGVHTPAQALLGAGGRGASNRQLQGCPAFNLIYFYPSWWTEKAGAPFVAGHVDILLP